mmetsp:Transcript_33687/g.54595  ORF Transcript_33687/g.54595 Transcript_33687/m.54595 type:complete len:306 (-) Transcript_33687:932-1849(-)
MSECVVLVVVVSLSCCSCCGSTGLQRILRRVLLIKVPFRVLLLLACAVSWTIGNWTSCDAAARFLLPFRATFVCGHLLMPSRLQTLLRTVTPTSSLTAASLKERWKHWFMRSAVSPTVLSPAVKYCLLNNADPSPSEDITPPPLLNPVPVPVPVKTSFPCSDFTPLLLTIPPVTVNISIPSSDITPLSLWSPAPFPVAVNISVPSSDITLPPLLLLLDPLDISVPSSNIIPLPLLLLLAPLHISVPFSSSSSSSSSSNSEVIIITICIARLLSDVEEEGGGGCCVAKKGPLPPVPSLPELALIGT